MSGKDVNINKEYKDRLFKSIFGRYENREWTLSLYNAINGTDHTDVELKVTMLNINYGHNKELMDKCAPLKEYSWFVYTVREFMKTTDDIVKAVDNALMQMPRDFVIRDFLISNREEVRNMWILEYDAEEAKAEWKEDGRIEGIKEGRERGIKEGHERGVKEGHERGIKEGHEQGVKEGHEQGVKEGHELGVKEGHERGVIEGAEKAMLASIINIMDSMKISADEAMSILKIPAGEHDRYRQML